MIEHLTWPLTSFETVRDFDRSASTRFPIKYLRYWFPRMALEKLHSELGRPLSVLEVGIGGGQIIGFLGGSNSGNDRFYLPSWIERWDGLDINAEQWVLDRYEYSDYIQADVERTFDLKGRRYHAVVVNHLLEHLLHPEQTICRLSEALNPNAIVVGGSPTMPDFAACLYEPWLRWKYRRVLDDALVHRHVSVISPGRIKRFARQNKFDVDLLAGAFFCRSSGCFLENFEGWTRANLRWGAVFPALGGEVYFSLRRQA